MIVVIPWTWPLRKGGTAESKSNPAEWLPRKCPRCAAAVIGHGRRNKQAHDEHRTRICVRRGICKGCGQTITVLPAWSLPYTHYTLYARQLAVNGWIDGARLEDAAPVMQDPDRVADAHTLRRWFERRIESWWMCLHHALWLLPTIFAWDCRAAIGMLVAEAKPA